MRFTRQEYWSGLPCSPPGDLPDPGIKPTSPDLQADSLPLSHQGSLSPYLARFKICFTWLAILLADWLIGCLMPTVCVRLRAHLHEALRLESEAPRPRGCVSEASWLTPAHRRKEARLWVQSHCPSSLHFLTYLLYICKDILSAPCKICLGPTCVCYIISSPSSVLVNSKNIQVFLLVPDILPSLLGSLVWLLQSDETSVADTIKTSLIIMDFS